MKLLTIKILKMKTITFKFKENLDQEEMAKEMIRDIDKGHLIGNYDNSDPDNLVIIFEHLEDSEN